MDAVTASPQICPGLTVRAFVTNIGNAPAPLFNVRFCAGSPERRGFEIGQAQSEVVLPPGESVTLSAETSKLLPGQEVRVHAVADPDDQLHECDETNNTGVTPMGIECRVP